ncbi:MAG: RNA polymerase-associated protein RapA [Lentisphaerae bacterium ADurb.Bin082]|nr:MAG: RNA polymerase-associated protein RapA [Lentisphaerae bacterium ADurb.Bin082]
MTAAEIRKVRKALGLTQQQFAAQLGVSFTAVNRWERGHNTPQPDREMRIRELHAEYLTKAAGSEPQLPLDMPVQLDFEGDPESVKLVVDSVRLRNGHLFNKAYGLELSRVVPLPHQRIAVYEHLLPVSPLRFLLADDAGAGKTIMAGLYILEMLNRGRIHRVLICCPAGLVFNWQRELRFFFELDFTILRGADFRNRDPLAEKEVPHFIMSVDTAATPAIRERLASPNGSGFDLVVFDEAHKLSWSDPNRGDSKTLRYQLAEALARRAPNILLLTATPHMGKEFPYCAIWRLLDPAVFSTVEAVRTLTEQKRNRHFIRRLKEEMVTYDGQPIYKPRLAQTIPVTLTPEEREFYEAATAYLQWSYENNRALNRNAAAMVVAVLQRRLASSTYALSESLRRIKEKRLAQQESPTATSPGLLDRLIAEIDAATADDSEPTDDGAESSERLEEQVLAAMRPKTQSQLQQELLLIDGVLELGQKVNEDAKFARLRELIDSPEYHREKVLIFTEHRDTLVYLQNQFAALGYTDRVAVIHGGMDATERERQRAFFMPVELRGQLMRPEDLARLNPPKNSATLMVATDAAGEGINLQFAWIMVNYDIPWNPARLEQRMGRLHRFGQRHSEVRIFNLVAEQTREGDVLHVILDKLDEARRALSTDKVFDVIGQQLPESSIRDLLLDSLLHPQSEQWRKQLDAWLATQKLREAVEKQRRQASQFGDVGRRIGQLQTEMDVENFTHLLPAYVQNFVEKSADPLSFTLSGDLSRAARVSFDTPDAPWVQKMGARLLDGLPEYLSVRREPPPGELLGTRVHFLRPGDPFFEGLCDEVQERFRPATQRGAIFRDPTADKPYGAAFYVCQIGELADISDVNGKNKVRNLLDRRLLAVRWDEDGEFSVCAPNHLLALQAASKADLWKANRLLRQPDEQVEKCDQYARALAQSQFLQQVRTMLRVESDTRMEDMARGFDLRAAELAESRGELARKARDGDAAAATKLAEVKTQQTQLEEDRVRMLLREQRRADLLDIVTFERVAVALVVPDDSAEAQEIYDRNIEAIAVRVARNYEVDRYNARVIDVSAPHLAKGYDLESHRDNGEIVAIEVKGRAGRGPVQLTENEWPTAANVRERYWLYVVADCATAPVLYRVQDPAYKLAVKTRQSFTINFGDILREAEHD